jgi:hypothetical protein
MPWEKTTVPDRLSQQVTVLTHRRQPRAHHPLRGAPFSQGAISEELARLASSSAPKGLSPPGHEHSHRRAAQRMLPTSSLRIGTYDTAAGS